MEKLYIGFYKPGTQFTVTVDNVANNCAVLVDDVIMTFTLPTGLLLASYNIPRGTFDSVNLKWNVGGLLPGQALVATFTFEVSDDCEGPYNFDFAVESETTCDDCFAVDNLLIETEGISCCETASCYASHADDSAAAASGIELGQLYYNTTIGAVVARLA